MRALNCGSGQRPFAPPWINLDVQFREHGGVWPNVVGDMFHMPFPEGSMDYVVSHHTLEHCGHGDADGFISEAWKVLRPGGSLLVFVPDLRLLAKRWLTHQLSTELYMFQMYGAYMGSEYDRHKWGYDYDYLYEYMRKWYWRTVKAFDWRPIEGADVARDWYIIGMECIR